METIRDLDYEWYWLGYSMGVNSRKRIKPSADRLTNMGKMGVITIPNEQQKTSFFLGLMVGRRKIVNNLDIIEILTTQSRKELSTADMLTLAVQKKECERGQYVDIAVFINKNAAENRGVAGFQLKLSYNKDYLDLVSITKANSWTGSFVSDTSIAGYILAQGVKEVADKQDVAICYIKFYVKSDVPSGVSEIPLTLQGQIGTGSGSELLTLINDELYYITPIRLQHGAILLEKIDREPVPEPSLDIPAPSSPGGSGGASAGSGSSVSYDFEADMDYPAGVNPSGLVYVIISIYFDGELVGEEKIPLEPGYRRYQGKIPLQLPSLRTGKVTYNMRIEPENLEDEGFYYVFIRAGALFTLEAVIPREEVGQIELEPWNREVIDRMWITDFVEFEVFKQSGDGPVDLVIIDNIIVISDRENIHIKTIKVSEVIDQIVVITDTEQIDNQVIKNKPTTEGLRVTDIIDFSKE